jgi:hypothetical protein
MEEMKIAITRARRRTDLSRAFFFEDLETMKNYSIKEILDTQSRIDALDREMENRVDDELYELAGEDNQ